MTAVPICRVAYTLVDVTVHVETEQPMVLSYLDEFYTRGASTAPGWTVRARIAPGAADMRRNRFGVGVRANPKGRVVEIAAPTLKDLAIVTRKCLREVMVARCESAGFTMLHASAIARPGRVVVFAADKRAGKTTLALRAALEHGWRYLSNDHLIVFPDHDDLVLTSLPTLLPVKVGTLLDVEHLLPAKPIDDRGLDLDWWRFRSRENRYATDAGVYYTYGRLGQDNPIAVRLNSGAARPELVVVFPSYASSAGIVGPPESVADGWRELVRHIRVDWVFDPGLNQRYLPRQQRDPERFAHDGQELCRQLARRARFLCWQHRGDPAPLLRALAEEGDR
ncbi:MAG: hypothetical protein GEV03_26830 [Streptosporangiales bacterium]|nr:hypothetical protein [Streptosporangiales bacterium]